MTDPDTIKLSDFMHARVVHFEGEVFSTKCSKPQYSAPEVLVGREGYRGKPVDVWSCGVLLYFMVTHTVPFDDPDPEVGVFFVVFVFVVFVVFHLTLFPPP